MENLGEVYKKIIDSINLEIDKDVIIIDRDVIVATSKNIKKQYFNKTISHNLEEKIKSAVPVYSKEKAKISIVSQLEIIASYSISQIFISGEVIGAVMVISEKEDLSQFDIKICNMISNFLSKYLEE